MFSTCLTCLILLSVFFSLLSGTAPEAGGAILEGAQGAVSFSIGLTGSLCFYCALLELTERCGLSRALARVLQPVLRRLFPQSSGDGEVLQALSENFGANLLGLGNAATPAGIRAVRGMARLGERGEQEMSLLVVLNTASLQILPGTAAALRAAEGAASPFDIMPAVWISSALSVSAGLCAAALMRRLWR